MGKIEVNKTITLEDVYTMYESLKKRGYYVGLSISRPHGFHDQVHEMEMLDSGILITYNEMQRMVFDKNWAAYRMTIHPPKNTKQGEKPYAQINVEQLNI